MFFSTLRFDVQLQEKRNKQIKYTHKNIVLKTCCFIATEYLKKKNA